MKVGIIGAGSIAGTMAGTIREMDCAQNYAVAARDYGRAAEFAQTYGFEKAYGSYEELVEDAGVELVYIATPHSHHYEHIKLCLKSPLQSMNPRPGKCLRWPEKKSCF